MALNAGLNYSSRTDCKVKDGEKMGVDGDEGGKLEHAGQDDDSSHNEGMMVN